MACDHKWEPIPGMMACYECACCHVWGLKSIKTGIVEPKWRRSSRGEPTWETSYDDVLIAVCNRLGSSATCYSVTDRYRAGCSGVDKRRPSRFASGEELS